MELIKDELRSRQLSIAKDYKQIAEKIQREFEVMVNEKNALITENLTLNWKVENLEQIYEWTKKDFSKLEIAYQSEVNELEASKEKVADLESRNKALVLQLIEAEQMAKVQVTRLTAERENEVAELLDKESKLRKERDSLLAKIKDYLEVQIADDDMRSFLSGQFKQLSVNHLHCSDENESLRMKTQLLFQENKQLTELISQQKTDFKAKMDELYLEKELLISAYETKLKQIETNLENRFKASSLGADGQLAPLSFLDLFDQDFQRTFSLLINGQVNLNDTTPVIIQASDRGIFTNNADFLKKESTKNLQMSNLNIGYNSGQLNVERHLLVI